MNAALLLLALGFWILHAGSSFSSLLFLFSFYGLYLYFRFGKNWILFSWCLLFAWRAVQLFIPVSAPEPGAYQIEKIMGTSSIAVSEKGTQILLYTMDQPMLMDTYSVKEFLPISGTENLNVFSFQEYAENMGVYYQASVTQKDLLKTSDHPRARIYRRLSRSSEALQMFYSIGKSGTLFASMSLPLITLLSWLKKLLHSFLPSYQVLACILFLSSLYGYFFVFPVSLLRVCVFTAIQMLPVSSKKQLAFSIFLFLLLQPSAAFHIAFVLPVLFRFLYLFFSGKSRTWLSLLALCWLQLFYFSSLDLLSLAGYSLLRILSVCYFLLVSLSLFFPVPLPALDSLQLSISWNFAPSLLFLLPLAVIFYRCSKKFDVKAKCSLLAGFILIFVSPYMDPFFHIYILDIGQGDCALIQEPFHKSAVMIDCGQNLYKDNAETIILPFLRARHISSLDALILTHDDFDHTGCKETILETLDVKRVIESSTDEKFTDYPFLFVLPDREETEGNDASLISWFSYDGITCLFMGDASTKIEKQLLEEAGNIQADILKIGHHGSKTSSSYEFLHHLQPEIALISVGEKNRYGHPDQSVLSSLKEIGSNVLMTKDVGMIHIFSFHSFTFVQCADGQFSILPVDFFKKA